MSDLQTLIELVCERAFRDQRPVKHTLTGGTASTVVNSNLAYTSWSSNQFDRVGVYILSADDAAPEGEYRQVTDGGFTSSSGTWSVAPDFSANPASGDTALMLYGPDIQEILEALSEIKKSLYLPRYMPLSLASDPGMEDSGVTGYTGISTNETITKDTSTVLTGTQSLKVVTTADAEGVAFESLLTESQGFSSWETGTFYVSVVVQPDSRDIQVVFYDETNSTAVRTVDVSGDGRWHEVRFEEGAPTDSRSVSVRITTNGGSGTFYVDSQSVLNYQQRILELPSQVNDANHVDDVLYAPWGAALDQDDVYVPLSRAFEDWPALDPLRDYKAVHPHRIQLAEIRGPLWIRFRANESAYTNLAESASISAYHSQTTSIPDELIVTGALSHLQRRGSIVDSIDHTRRYFQLLDDLGLAKPVHRQRANLRTQVTWR